MRYLLENEAPIAVTRSHSEELQLALPSLNKLDAPAQPALPPSTPPSAALPAPPKPEPKKVMTAKANGVDLQGFLDKGWTEQQLIENGYMEIQK